MLRLAAAFLVLGSVPFSAFAEADPACLVTPTPGIDAADLETVAQILCSELRRQGIAVGEPTHVASAEAWKVGMRPLGRKVFLSLQHMLENGQVGREGEVLLNEIEEVPVIARRLVESIRTGTSLASTASVETLAGNETRKYVKKDGETFFGLGFLGMGIPGTDMVSGGGLLLRWSFETADFGVVGDLRFAGGSPADDEASFFSAGVGVRGFLSSGNWSPFLGAGMGFTVLSVEELGEFDGSQTGIGGWVEFGVEALRFYETRLSFDLRAELPFFEVERDDGFFFGEDDLSMKKRIYYVPVTFAIVYSF